MRQGRLLPLQIVALEPAGLGTADLREVGTGDDGKIYAVKRASNGPAVPLSEWICTKLAEACGLTVPDCVVAKLPDGEAVFASQWEGGTMKSDDMARQLLGMDPGARYGDALGRIWAFDQFVSNPDRHARNYLLRAAHRDDRAPLLYAIDWSRAFLVAGWPLPPVPLSPACNTSALRAAMVNVHGAGARAGMDTLDRLQSLSDGAMHELLAEQPWLDGTRYDEIDRWWRRERVQRLDAIRTLVRHV